MAAEGKLREKLKKRVEAYGGEIRAVAWLGRRYAPDVMCLFPHDSAYRLTLVNHGSGRWYLFHPFIETKAPGGKPTVGQAREHERMRAAGCVVLVISTEEQLDEWLPPL